MNRQPDVELVLREYFAEDGSIARDHVLDIVEERIARQPQRPAWRLRRRPIVNTYAKLAASLAAVVIVAFVAWGLVPRGSNSGGTSAPGPTISPAATPTNPPTTSTPRATSSQTGSFGGTAEWRDNGAPITTEIDAVASGATVTGTAVHTFRGGTHTVRLQCVARDGDTWALAGKVEKSTLPGEEKAGYWSRVIVKDGSPQQISIWLSSDEAPAGIDCEDFLATFGFAELGPENFAPVESGELVPPPDLAS